MVLRNLSVARKRTVFLYFTLTVHPCEKVSGSILVPRNRICYRGCMKQYNIKQRKETEKMPLRC